MDQTSPRLILVKYIAALNFSSFLHDPFAFIEDKFVNYGDFLCGVKKSFFFSKSPITNGNVHYFSRFEHGWEESYHACRFFKMSPSR